MDNDVQEFQEWLRSWGAAAETVRARTTVITAALRVWPVRPTTADLARWLADPGFSPWTRVTYYGHARSWFGWLKETGRRGDDPTEGLRPPRTPKGAPRPLSADQARVVVDRASGRLRTWLLLGMLAGLRASEVAKLRGEDVSEETIYVRGKGGSVGFIPTHPVLWAEAQGYPREGWWFPSSRQGGHISAQQVSSRTSRHFRECGVEGSFHRCRHTYGTRLLQAGVNVRVVQSLMRHASLGTTAAYLGVEDAERAAAVARLGVA